MSYAEPNKNGGLFGNPFDLNGDGRTDAAEAALMFMMLDDMLNEEKTEQKSSRNRTVDLDDLDIEGI